MADDLVSCVDAIHVYPGFGYLVDMRNVLWDYKVEVGIGVHRVLAGADSDGDVRSVVSRIYKATFEFFEVQFAPDITANTTGKRCGNRYNRRPRQERLQCTKSAVLLAELSSPVRYAMRLVNKNGYDLSREHLVTQNTIDKVPSLKHL